MGYNTSYGRHVLTPVLVSTANRLNVKHVDRFDLPFTNVSYVYYKYIETLCLTRGHCQRLTYLLQMYHTFIVSVLRHFV